MKKPSRCYLLRLQREGVHSMLTLFTKALLEHVLFDYLLNI